MGDGQWEDIETEMNSVLDENNSYADSECMHPDADASISSTGKEIECMGECGGGFWSDSGTSTNCTDCRE